MANKNQLLRYLIIDEMLRNRQRPYPSREEIMQTIEERTDRPYSLSSFEKDLRVMREQFGAPIEYHHERRGYFYGEKLKKSGKVLYEEDRTYRLAALSLSKQDLQSITLIEGLLEGFRHQPFFHAFSQAIDKVLDAVQISKQIPTRLDNRRLSFIQTDEPEFVKGRELLGELAAAIQNHRQVQFEYMKFKSEESSRRTLHPLLLKSFKNRWYLVGYEERKGRIATFGLDRVLPGSLRLLDAEALDAEKLQFDPEEYYRYCYGVTRNPEDKPKRVLLACTPLLGKYLETRPLHHTQRITEKNEVFWEIEYRLIINQELLYELLSMSPDVQVLKPKKLKRAVVETLEKTLSLYRL
ncbi:MAG: hypothetical protein KatS3mg033_0135 [Thermonema sp.]|uniref:helix-turn-helix transcriptional regulator n=1 Tax=Thermonema sp. TaxID=2231181 RepID=UPI0021DEE34B|nr:WYL domain-containing protein [Thermonema sp.]GIV38335.1 MAG: hypothetical protein KatS3mg033_0135 [Thermonema sp.]